MYHKQHEWAIDRIYENANDFPYNVRIPLTGNIMVYK
jgi:hypothetical protein